VPEFEDFVDSKVAITALVTAAVLSPQGRRALRRGAVYGTAGVLMARDAVAGFGRGITRWFSGGRFGSGQWRPGGCAAATG
jgi:hypothetical protein